MKDFLKHHGLWVLFAAAVIAVALAAMSLLSNTSSPLVNVANVLASPFRSAYTAVATWFNDKQNYYKDTTALEEENAALRRRLHEVRAQARVSAAREVQQAGEHRPRKEHAQVRVGHTGGEKPRRKARFFISETLLPSRSDRKRR